MSSCHPINAFKDGGVSVGKARRSAKDGQSLPGLCWSGSRISGAGARRTRTAVEELKPVGLKLYPNSYSEKGVIGWLMDDPEIAFRYFSEPSILAQGHRHP